MANPLFKSLEFAENAFIKCFKFTRSLSIVHGLVHTRAYVVTDASSANSTLTYILSMECPEAAAKELERNVKQLTASIDNLIETYSGMLQSVGHLNNR